MSNITQFPPDCIQANPELTGIGIRASIYFQSFFVLGVALYATIKGTLTRAQFRVLASQGNVIVLATDALLLSAFIRAKTLGLSTYHAIIILNLAWMNNLSMFSTLVIFFHLARIAGQRDGAPSPPSRRGAMRQATNGRQGFLGPTPTVTPAQAERKPRDLRQLIPPLPVLLGSLQFVILSAFGLWFWATVNTFGTRAQCEPQLPIVLHMLGDTPSISSLRKISLLTYSFLAIPILNLLTMTIIVVTPTLAVLISVPTCLDCSAKQTAKKYWSQFVFSFWFGMTLVTVMIIVVTETMVKGTKSIVQSGENQWTFSQTIMLFLSAFPVVEYLCELEQQRRRHAERRKQREIGMPEGHGNRLVVRRPVGAASGSITTSPLSLQAGAISEV